MWVAEWNEVVFTNESRTCLQHLDGRIRVWRHRGERMLSSYVMHRHTGPAPSVMVWGGIGYHSRTPLVRIAGSLNSQRYISEVLEPVVLPYLQGLATAIFQQDNAQPHVERIVQRFFVNHQIELLPWPARSPDLSPIENMWSMVAQLWTRITPPAAPPDQLWQRVESAFGLLYPKNTSKFSLKQCRGVWQWRSPTMAATLATDSGRNHTLQNSINLIIFDTCSTCYLQNKFCCAISCLSFLVLHLRWPAVLIIFYIIYKHL
ncbi:transposable element Tc3 transposase [Trichonephila clavipes]|uniref:Transposable element Tc3 transposase n=1 Tax=Trichonephila clavipes TaxID=2585209 RepID=A0A8X6VKV3_TRICX|nr:transposable element Tc3 transposase [Trichonephila clavipes]